MTLWIRRTRVVREYYEVFQNNSVQHADKGEQKFINQIGTDKVEVVEPFRALSPSELALLDAFKRIDDR